MNGLMRSSVSALIGAAIGAAVWAGITYSSGMEIGWIAWGVGFVVGLAVRIGCGDDLDGFLPGGVAVVGAILALVVGKYAAIHLLINNELGDVTVEITAANMQVGMADEIAAEWESEGKRLNWPRNMDYDSASEPGDYPPKVWEEAQKRWNEIPPEEQEAQIAQRTQLVAEMQGMFTDGLAEEAFKASFSPMDLLFFGLAIFTAFKLGSGMAADE